MGNGEGGGIKVDKVGGWGGGEVGRWENSHFIQGWGMKDKSKISSFLC